MADRLQGFVSYSHVDAALFEELMKHLKEADLADFWNDQEIPAGIDWDKTISTKLKTAHVILLLISIDFMVSDYIKTVEVKEAMERHERGEVRVIPIIIRTVDWDNTPYHKLQALPEKAKPVDEWRNKDAAFVNIVQGIRKSLQELQNSPAWPMAPSKRSISTENLQKALLSLDYRDQADAFHRVIDNEAHVGAFLIHGKMEYGQAWLLHRLLSNPRIENVNKPPFKFQLTNKSAGRNLGRLWVSMGRWLNSRDPQMLPAAIVEQVYTLWQKQSMIFILTDIDGANQSYLQEFLHDFWEPLIETIHRNGQLQNPPQSYLLLFLVDNVGVVEKWALAWKEELDIPGPPVKLKRLRDFTPTDVKDWIQNERDRYGLPPTLKPDAILGKGCKPETVLYQIYELCGYQMYEHESAW